MRKRRSAPAVLAACLLLGAAASAAEPALSPAEALRASGLPGGFCVQLGATDGGTTAALGAGGKFLVHGLVLEAGSLEKVRERIRARGGYGRVSVDAGSFKKLPYADGLVNLLLVEDFPKLQARGLELRELARVLAPGAAACLGRTSAEALGGRLDAAGFKGVKAATSGGWTILTKPRPAGADEWTHFRHNPARTVTSRDALVGPPRRMRWIDAPRRSRNHRAPPAAAVSAGGRLFYVFDYGPLFSEGPARVELVARDAYSGVVLWRRKVRAHVDEFFELHYPGAAVVAVGGKLYAPLQRGGPLAALNAATGQTLRTYQGTSPDSVVHLGKELLLLERGRVRLIDEAGGAQRWSAAVGGYKNRMVVGGGRVYVHVTRRGKLVCLDLARGTELWRKEDPAYHKDTCLAGLVSGVLVHSVPGLVRGLSAGDGSLKWTCRYNMSGRGSPWNVFFSGGLVWVHDLGRGAAAPEAWVGLDPAGGGVKKRIPVRFTDKCARGAATERYLITGRLDFTDWRSGKSTNTKASRGACRFTPIPANGMLYTFPTDCRCFPQLKGIMGLGPAPAGAGPVEPEKSGQLLRGPAAGSSGPPAGAEDWPVYRRDPERRASSPTKVPAGLKELWSVEIGGRPSPPTVAAGKVFVASVEAHRVHALKASSGEPLWSYAAGGRVDGPPTYYRGLAIFGCRDGRVYCLDASSGKLAWRFRAAPAERRVVAYGQPESAWPVSGSLPVVDGRVYCAAGRHTGLDGGIFICALEAATGRPVWKARPERTSYSDLLVRNGSWMYMRLAGFDLETGRLADRRRSAPDFFYSGLSSPFEDDTYAYRTQWRLGGGAMAQMLCFDSKRVAGVTGYLDDGKYSAARPGKGDYRLFLSSRAGAERWSARLPVKPRALVLTAGAVFVAGPEDAAGPRSSELRGYAAGDGKLTAELKLEALPVFDGLAAARGRLYLPTEDGKLRCFGKK